MTLCPGRIDLTQEDIWDKNMSNALRLELKKNGRKQSFEKTKKFYIILIGL